MSKRPLPTDKHRYDAIIVGGGVAGTTLAILLRQRGLSVALVEKKTAKHHKVLCTHFIQPSAIPVLAGLGLASILQPQLSFRTKAAFITSAGVIDPPGAYSAPTETAYAYNLERSVLDPALRAHAEAAGVELFVETAVLNLCLHHDRMWQVRIKGVGSTSVLQGRVVVAADGRRSRIAQQMANPTRTHENHRAAVFAYYDGVPPPRGDRSLFVLAGTEMGFAYPLVGGRVLLSAYVEKPCAATWRHAEDPHRCLLDFFKALDVGLDLRHASPLTPVFGYADYPSQLRKPVHALIPFIGDAALSLDPMSGVGCGFALESAALLDAELGPALTTNSSDEITAALTVYERRYTEHFLPHAEGIIADSLIAKQAKTQSAVYHHLVNDPLLQQDYLALTGRLLTPKAFQRAYLASLMRAPAHIDIVREGTV